MDAVRRHRLSDLTRVDAETRGQIDDVPKAHEPRSSTVITFMAPDMASMSGGLQVIYRMAEHLKHLGFDARVWHGTPGHHYDGFECDADVVTGRQIRLEPGDVLVMPEVGGSKWANLNSGAPVVMLVQGVDFVFANSEFSGSTEHDYPGWPDARGAISVSETIEEFLREVVPSDFPLYRVPLEIDADLYSPRTKEPLIAFMPRRRKEDLLGVIHLLRRSGALDARWELLPIDGMSQAEVAHAMGRAAIFLNGGEREGFGLPGAEALAAGCHVIGFTGHGGREYMRSDFADVIAESDVVDMARTVRSSMAEFDEDQEAFRRRSERGRAFIIENYGSQAQADALSAAFTEILKSSAVLTQPVLASHYQTHAPDSAAARAYVSLRTFAGRLRRSIAR